MTAVIIIVVIVVIAALVATAVVTRRRRLQRQFGPEYDRAVTEQNSRLRAEAELTDRQRRVRKLDIKPLSDDARRRYAADWVVIQEHFVDSPQTAVTEAYDLVTTVMTERGYPMEDDEQLVADLSVEHAATVGHFRDAQHLTTTAAAGDAATEDLRQALIHYRALFSDLLGDQYAPHEQTVVSPAADGRLANGAARPAPDTEPDGYLADPAVQRQAIPDQADRSQR